MINNSPREWAGRRVQSSPITSRDNVIICDLDGTLCDVVWRVHHAQAREWEQFHAGIPNDQPIQAVLKLLDAWRHFGTRSKVIFATGRHEQHRAATEAWLEEHGIIWHDLYMRPDDDYRSDVDVKRDMGVWIRDVVGCKIVVVFDDRDRVVAMWRELGFPCFQVANGTY